MKRHFPNLFAQRRQYVLAVVDAFLAASAAAAAVCVAFCLLFLIALLVFFNQQVEQVIRHVIMTTTNLLTLLPFYMGLIVAHPQKRLPAREQWLQWREGTPHFRSPIYFGNAFKLS